MGDQVGLFVLLGVIVVMAGGFALTLGARGKSENDTLNSHEDQTVRQRADHPEGAERSHLVGNPPIDSITTEGGAEPGPARAPSPRSSPRTCTPTSTTATGVTAATDARQPSRHTVVVRCSAAGAEHRRGEVRMVGRVGKSLCLQGDSRPRAVCRPDVPVTVPSKWAPV